MGNLFEKDRLKNSTLFNKAIAKGLKIGYLDIETSPYLVWTYPLREANIGGNQIEKECKITSAVLLIDGKPTSKGSLTVYEAAISDTDIDDREMLKHLVEDINALDLVVMQNGDRFDALVIQDRLFRNKLESLEGLVTIDTLKLSRRSFKRAGHGLDYRSSVVGRGGKLKQDMSDCIAVAKGCKKTQKTRVKYNIKDVYDTRSVFLAELDYYNLPQTTLKLLKKFGDTSKDFCVKCAARRQSRYKLQEEIVQIKKNKKEKRTVCQNCGHHWKIKH